jgi:hypothetical protein
MGTVGIVSKWSSNSWQFVTDIGWNSVGGYGLNIGAGNIPYVAAMHGSTFAVRIWKWNGEAWDMVGPDIDVPIGQGGSWGDKIFCLTSGGQGVYTIGHDYSDPGVSVASYNGLMWTIEKLSSTGSCDRIAAANNTIYASVVEGSDYLLYQKVNGTWSTTTMSTTGVAATSFDMAVSPSGTLYAARLEGSNVIIKKLSGSSWQNVPASSSGAAFTTTSGSQIQILPGTAKCYAIVKTSSEWIVWSISL